MGRNTTIWVTGAGLLVGAVAVWTALDGPGPQLEQRPPAAEVARAVRQSWRVALTAETTVAMGEAPLGGRVVFTGPVSVEVTSPRERVLRFGTPERLEVRVLGRDEAEPLALAGHRARVRLDAHGAVDEIAVSAGASASFRHLARLVAPELLPPIPASEVRWSAEERTPQGIADATFTRDGREVRRGPRAYRQLLAAASLGVPASQARVAGGLTAQLDEAGAPVSVRTDERVQISGVRSAQRFEASLTLTAQRTGVAPGDPAVASGTFDVLPPMAAAAPAGPDARDRVLAARAGDLTAVALAARVAGATRESIGGPEHAGFLVQASALLERSPEAVRALEAAWSQPGTSDAARDLGLDLLASAGSPAAQAAAVRLLRAEVAADAPLAGARVQRLLALDAPAAETVAFLRQVWREGPRPKVRMAAAYTLGAVAHALGRSGEPARADALAAELEAALDDAPDEDRAHYVAALGNAGRPRSAEVLAELVDAPSAELRRAVAIAIRRLPPSAAWGPLLVDPDPAVQKAAIRSFASHGAVAPVIRAAAEGRIAAANFGVLHTLFQRHVETRARGEIAAALETMLATPGVRPGLRARLTSLAQVAKL